MTFNKLLHLHNNEKLLLVGPHLPTEVSKVYVYSEVSKYQMCITNTPFCVLCASGNVSH